ncbi:hypothetical protein HD806DRAFT_492231 [Xylariaceae sp. AK1471]|nr:hypothetical protein HD806DRAFT_492231 [Xylariaceae sp. AK1471]
MVALKAIYLFLLCTFWVHVLFAFAVKLARIEVNLVVSITTSMGMTNLMLGVYL